MTGTNRNPTPEQLRILVGKADLHVTNIGDEVFNFGEILAKLIKERDDADRRAGAAERHLEGRLDGDIKWTLWRDEQKLRRGYHTNVSFDRVWAETCALADAAKAAGLQPVALSGEEG